MHELGALIRSTSSPPPDWRRAVVDPAVALLSQQRAGLFLLLSTALMLFDLRPVASQLITHPSDNPALEDPEDGKVTDNLYRNAYFDLSYRLPAGWRQGWQGPPPSYVGYYVLDASVSRDKSATLLIAAQDMFFAAKSLTTARAMVEDLARLASRSDSMKVDREPSQVMLAGRAFARVDLSGANLSRVVLATEIRCHILSFVVTSADRRMLDAVVASFNGLTLLPPAREAMAGAEFPLCAKDYAGKHTILRKVEPSPSGPAYLRIPVRIIIGADGRVKHIHVIRAFPDQKRSIEEALVQWEFTPYQLNGHAVEVETGLTFEFKPRETEQGHNRVQQPH
jgi:hypothetical protein